MHNQNRLKIGGLANRSVGLFAVALLAAACAGSQADSSGGRAPDSSLANSHESTEGTNTEPTQGSDGPDTTTTSTTIGTVAAGTTAPSAASRTLTFDDAAAPDDLRFETVAAMGGLRLGFDAEHRLIATGDYIGFDPDPSGARAWNSPALIALVTQSVSGETISTIDEFLATALLIDGATAEPSGRSIDLFGYSLVGYSFDNDSFQVVEGPVFGTSRMGASNFGGWGAMPTAELFLAETGNGVLAVGVSGLTVDDHQEGWDVLDDVIPNLELTGLLDDTPADVNALRVSDKAARPEQAETADQPDVLDDPWLPVRPGPYQIHNLGEVFEIDVPLAFAAKHNFPGVVVLAASDSFGPSIDSLTMHTGVASAQFATTAPGPIGGVVDMSDLDTFLADPPHPLVIDEIDEVTIGGRDGVQFDVSFRPDIDCSEAEPCVFVLRTSYGLVERIRSGSEHRFWWFDDFQDGPLVLSSSTTHPDDWWPRIHDVVESIRFTG